MEKVIVLPLEELLHRLAQHFVSFVNQQVVQKGCCIIVLTGGNTCRPFYQLVAAPTYSREVPWDKVHVFLTDERMSPPQLAGSNFQTIWDDLLQHVPISTSHVYPIHTLPSSYEESARAYSQQIQQVFASQQQLQFDWVLMGLGEDGHIASLFPADPILESEEPYADVSYAKNLASWRVSLTYNCLLKSGKIIFLVTGLAKQTILKKLLKDQISGYPVSKVIRESENSFWFVDKIAGALIAEV